MPIDFDPRDYESECGNMVMWDENKGGKYPWDANYYTATPDTSTGFDPEYIMRHATDSAATASAYATGHKTGTNMMSVNMYEEDVSTLVEDAIMCGKSGGVVTSVPMLHATPGSFITHSNYRKNGPQMQRGLRKINPTFVSGTCASRYQPSPEMKLDMINGTLSKQWTFLTQQENVTAEMFYDGIQDLDPDDDQHIMVCLGGDYTPPHPINDTDVVSKDNLPYRGIDSSYSNRWCSNAIETMDEQDKFGGFNVTSELCDHYTAEEIAQIPHISRNVEEALKFLGKDDEGFFLMYEQGDIDWAAHANHMDDMLGTMLDIDDSVKVMIDWIAENGGWEKNALYVTADHDHYLTLNDQFPEALAHFIIEGETYKMTPENNSNKNPWEAAIEKGRHDDGTQSTSEHIQDFATWTPEDVEAVGHFWGPRAAGGNGWGSHSTRPVPLFYAGDDGCVEALKGLSLIHI